MPTPITPREHWAQEFGRRTAEVATARDVWYHALILTMCFVALKLFVFNWQNPELTEIQVLQEAAGWSWRHWAGPVVGAAVYVAVVFVHRSRRAT